MEMYISGIAFWNDETQKWQDTCLPIAMSGPIGSAKARTTKRAKSFGLNPTSEWIKKDGICYRDFQCEFGKIRRAFIVFKNSQSIICIIKESKESKECLEAPR